MVQATRRRSAEESAVAEYNASAEALLAAAERPPIAGGAAVTEPEEADLEDELVVREADPATEAKLLKQAGVYRKNGRLMRKVRVYAGREYVQDKGREMLVIRHVERPVALDLMTARLTGADYWDPRLGWINGGRKRAQEYPENTGTMPEVAGVEYEEVGHPVGPL